MQQSDSSVDKENENESSKKDDSEPDEADTEGEDGDGAEAEYLMEFEQTKKLQVIIVFTMYLIVKFLTGFH